MKALFFRSDGTVTVFCALIMMLLVVFFMVLIDMSRILLFQRTTESAVKLSAQSMVSAYDRQLYTKYGLFARGGTDSEQLFRQALELNLMNSLSVFSFDQGNDFAAAKLEDIAVFPTEFLGQHQVFERQVLEEMKYKGPIDFTVELLEEWLPIQSAVDKASGLMEVMNELEHLFKEREELLLQALTKQKQLGSILTSRFKNSVVQSSQSTINSYGQYIGWIKQQDDILKEINDSLEEIEPEALEKLYDRLDRYGSQISSYQRTASNVVQVIREEGNQLPERASRLADEIDNHIQAASALDRTISIKYELYLKQHNRQPSGANQLDQELNELQFDDTMIRGENFFRQYRSAIQTQLAEATAIVSDGISLADMIQALVDRPNTSTANSRELSSASELREQLKQHIESYHTDYSTNGAKIAHWESNINQQQEVISQLAQYEQQFKEELDAFEALKSLFQSGEKLQEAQADYDALHSRYRTNAERNAEQASAGIEAYTLSGNGKQQAQQSTAQLSKVMGLMAQAATNVRNEIYLNEFILGKYASFPLGEISLSEGELSSELFQASKQEVEYILYGVHKPLANVLLAYGEIFAVRFAIRTIEGFVANRGLTHPLLILGAAVAHGIRYAVQDMNELMKNGKTELSKYVPIDVSYEQYLRLFLLLHFGNKPAKLSRMIAVIEQNTGLSLLQLPTSLTTSAQLSMKLWLLPEIANALIAQSATGSEVEGNVYKKMEMVTASY